MKKQRISLDFFFLFAKNTDFVKVNNTYTTEMEEGGCRICANFYTNFSFSAITNSAAI